MSEEPPPAQPEPEPDPQPLAASGASSPLGEPGDSSALDAGRSDSPPDEASPEACGDRRLRGAPWVLLALALAFALIHSQLRPIDSDEGFYASAIHLVTQGQIPHRDFFSTQTPLQPYLYAPVELLSGRDLFSLRLWSVVLLGLALAALIAWAKERLPLRGALLSSLVLLTSVGLISWSVCVKTYAGLNALVAIALLLLWRACLSGRRATFLAAGVLLGLATGVRLFGIVPWGAFGLVCLACSLRGDLRDLARRALIPLAVGFLLGLIPTIVLAALSPEATYFGVWRYHQLRSVAPPLLDRLKNLVALVGVIAGEQPQLMVLAGLALGGLALLKQGWRDLPAGERLFWLGAGAILAAYTLANSIPWPVFPQYFTATLPIFLFPFAGLACAKLAKNPRAALLVAVLTLAGGALGFARGGAERWSAHPHWTPRSYRLACAEIARRTPPGGRVVAFWPGHVYGGGVEFYPDAVNEFSLFVAAKVSPAERARFHLFGPEELIASLSGPERAATFVTGREPPAFRKTLSSEQFARLKGAIKAGYRVEAEVDGVKILVRKDSPTSD